MPHIILSLMTISCQYENNTLSQQNNSGTVLLSHRQYSSSVSHSDLVFTIMPHSIDLSHTQLDTVILELPIQRYCFYERPFRNRIIVTSDNSFSVSKLRIEITPNSFFNHSLCLNITDLFRTCNPNQIFQHKITLSLEYPNLSIQIRNQIRNFSGMHVYYHTIFSDCTAKRCTCPSIELSYVRDNNCLIASNQILYFESINLDSSSGITYSVDTGRFSFSYPGTYYAKWILHLVGTGALELITIGLCNQTTSETFDFHSPCVIPCQICGQHILHISDTSYKYSLVNSSEATIQLSNIATNASLVIFKL